MEKDETKRVFKITSDDYEITQKFEMVRCIHSQHFSYSEWGKPPKTILASPPCIPLLFRSYCIHLYKLGVCVATGPQSRTDIVHKCSYMIASSWDEIMMVGCLLLYMMSESISKMISVKAIKSLYRSNYIYCRNVTVHIIYA